MAARAAKRSDAPGNETIGHVDAERERLSTRRMDEVRRLPAVADVLRDDVRAFFGQPRRVGPTDVVSSAGDDGDTAV